MAWARDVCDALREDKTLADSSCNVCVRAEVWGVFLWIHDSRDALRGDESLADCCCGCGVCCYSEHEHRKFGGLLYSEHEHGMTLTT